MAPSPTELISRADGKGLTTIAKNGIGGYLLAVAAAAITSTQEIFALLVVTPAQVMQDITSQAGSAIFIDPLQVVTSGAETSASSVTEFGILGLLVGTAIVLVTFRLVTWYLSDDETSDLIPGTVTDLVPFAGAEEEED